MTHIQIGWCECSSKKHRRKWHTWSVFVGSACGVNCDARLGMVVFLSKFLCVVNPQGNKA